MTTGMRMMAVMVTASLIAQGMGQRVCGGCEAQVSTAYLRSAVRPAVLNSIFNTQDIKLGNGLGGALRAAFHDVGAFALSDNEGRGNGCFLGDDPGNAGLQPMGMSLAQVYKELPKVPGFSRADLLQYAGLVAIEESYNAALTEFDGGPLPPLPPTTERFRFGRIDATDCPETGFTNDGDDSTSIEAERFRLPPPNGNFETIFDIFVTRMGLSLRDLVALSGGHTLGSANGLDGSGHEGQWVSKNWALGNQYFVNILDRPWARESVNGNNFQWGTPSNAGLMMLNTDLGLVYDVEILGGGCRIVRMPGDSDDLCDPNGEGDALEARRLVEQYAGGPDRNMTAGLELWYRDFVDAMLRFGEVGYNDTELFEPCTLPERCFSQEPSVPSENVTKTTVDLVLLFDDVFREGFHDSDGFRNLLRERVSAGLAILSSDVDIVSIRRTRVIVDLRVTVPQNKGARARHVLSRDVLTLEVLRLEFEDAVETGLVGRLALARVNSDVPESQRYELGPELQGPFQSAGVDARSTFIGTSVSAVVVVLVSSCLLCVSRVDDDVQDLERAGQEARDQRKADRLALHAPRNFSEAAFELSYIPPQGPAERSDGEESESESESESRRRRRDRRRRHRDGSRSSSRHGKRDKHRKSSRSKSSSRSRSKR